jgi:cytochrome c peroxidase
MRTSTLATAFIILTTAVTGFAQEPREQYGAMFKPLPKAADSTTNPITPEKVALGKRLFFENSLSINKSLSCNSCHNLKTYGVDNESTSPGHEGKRGERNSPTVYNAALHIAQFWDGRAADVEEQALGPIMNPVEMGMGSEDDVLEELKSNKDYVAQFKSTFPDQADPLTFANIGKAIGAFERTLLTPSRFDQYLSGKNDALTTAEKKGFAAFNQSGCAICHNGVGVGGGMYQKLGLVKPYETKDLGRFALTQNEVDKFFFKVPSLRNIAKTAPYFHDGSVKTLEEAVKLMGEHQLGKTFNDEQIGEIVSFLNSLTGEIPKEHQE